MVSTSPRVLVIRGGAIGDFILTLPAIRLLRQNIPGCHLEVLGYPGIMDLAVKAGLADAVRSLEHRTMPLLFAREAVIDPALSDYLCSFTLIISYLYDPDSILRVNLERIGVKTVIECPHRVVPGVGHAAEQLAKPLEKLALFLEEPGWRNANFQVRSSGCADDPGQQTGNFVLRIAIHLGSGSERKNWPVEHWLRLATEIQSTRPEAKLVFITGEAEDARGVRTPCPGPSVESWHSLPLIELADRLGTCTLFLGHDSGISHLAAACGIPCVLLFGPTDAATWAPPQPSVRIIHAPGSDLKFLPYVTVRDTVLLYLRNL